MSATEFDPERSAALRRLLLDTVADEPRRRRRFQLWLTTILATAALTLAGGTAALALTGIIRFDAPPPAPVPTVTPTPTPSATPTPRATPTAPPLRIQTTPVQPHDVTSLPAQPRWSLDLPGNDTGCTGVATYTLSDGRALYLTGIRPKEYEGSDCVYEKTEDIGLALVDTENGRMLWTREWSFTPERMDFRTQLLVLGTSGRAVIAYPEAGVGPHEVLDLQTGKTLSPFTPDGTEFVPRTDMVAAPDASGDVILLTHHTDEKGQPLSNDVLSRVDPRDVANPRWTTTLDGTMADLSEMPDGATAIPVSFLGPGDPGGVMVDLTTGAVGVPLPTQLMSAEHISVGSTLSPEGLETLTGYGPDGSVAWTHTLPRHARLLTAAAPGTRPMLRGGPARDTGDLVAVDGTTVTLLDQESGETLWSVPAAGCPSWIDAAAYDTGRDAYILTTYGSSDGCTLSRTTGEQLPHHKVSAGFTKLVGGTALYVPPFSAPPSYDAPQDGGAYDLATGDTLWTRPFVEREQWSFDGGYLISRVGNHLESMG